MIPENAAPFVAAHELGHQANAEKVNPVLHRIQHVQRAHPGAWGLLENALPLGMATLAPSNSIAAKASPFVGAAFAAPLLIEEGMASLRGYNAMKRLGYSASQLGAARSALGNAWLSYAAPRLLSAMGPAAAMVAGRQLMDYVRKKNHRETQGDTLKKYREHKKMLAELG